MPAHAARRPAVPTPRQGRTRRLPADRAPARPADAADFPPDPCRRRRSDALPLPRDRADRADRSDLAAPACLAALPPSLTGAPRRPGRPPRQRERANPGRRSSPGRLPAPAVGGERARDAAARCGRRRPGRTTGDEGQGRGPGTRAGRAAGPEGPAADGAGSPRGVASAAETGGSHAPAAPEARATAGSRTPGSGRPTVGTHHSTCDVSHP